MKHTAEPSLTKNIHPGLVNEYRTLASHLPKTRHVPTEITYILCTIRLKLNIYPMHFKREFFVVKIKKLKQKTIVKKERFVSNLIIILNAVPKKKK